MQSKIVRFFKSLFSRETKPAPQYFPVKSWDEACLFFVKRSKLPAIPVKDSWFKNTPENWVRLLAAMAKFESNYKPDMTYQENFKNSRGEYVISTGLLQLSYESASGYGFKVTTDDLKNPFKNLEVAVKIMETLVMRDGVIAGSGEMPYQGSSKYWSVLRKSGKLEAVKALYLQKA